MVDDDDSSNSDSSDLSDHSSLHSSSEPIMNGKGPSQLDWMSKFTAASKATPKVGQVMAAPKTQTNGNDSTEAQSPIKGRPPPERRGITPSSSFKRGENEAPPQPEWMKKFAKMGIKSEEESTEVSGAKAQQQQSPGSSGNRTRSPSPVRRTMPAIPPTAPTTPSWMKQYRKMPSVAGTLAKPDLPPLVISVAPSAPEQNTDPAPAATTSTSPSALTMPTNPDPPKSVSSKKDWKSLLSASSGATQSAKAGNVTARVSPRKVEKPQPPPPPPPLLAPETPQWMNKFSTVGKGLPMAPDIDDDDDDDDESSDGNQSVASMTSVSSAISVEPEWMSTFNKVKSGVGAKKYKPPPRPKTTKEPEWLQKFHRRQPSQTGGALSPSSNVTKPEEEPEWMTRYREIGVRDVEASPTRSKPVFRPVQATTLPNVDLRTLPASVPNTAPTGQKIQSVEGLLKSVKPPLVQSGHHSFSSLPVGGILSAPASPSASGKTRVSGNMRMPHSLSVIQPPGLMSAPASPVTNGKAFGGISAPASPVGNHHRVMHATPPRIPPSPGKRAPSPTPEPKPKVVDPAAMGPEKPEWMKKVKAVAHSNTHKPEWMLRLQRRNQGLDESGPRKGTPPWKRRERLKEEQTRKLREETGLIPRYDESASDDGDLLGDDDDSEDSRSDAEVEEEEEEEEEVSNKPEWMRQFEKMHLKKAEVISAQGRAPQGISRLRRGSMQMIERSGKINLHDEPARAVPVVLPKTRRRRRQKSNRQLSDKSLSAKSEDHENDTPEVATTTGKAAISIHDSNHASASVPTVTDVQKDDEVAESELKITVEVKAEPSPAGTKDVNPSSHQVEEAPEDDAQTEEVDVTPEVLSAHSASTKNDTNVQSDPVPASSFHGEDAFPNSDETTTIPDNEVESNVDNPTEALETSLHRENSDNQSVDIPSAEPAIIPSAEPAIIPSAEPVIIPSAAPIATSKERIEEISRETGDTENTGPSAEQHSSESFEKTPSNYMNQVEIDTSAPTNVMGMWGQTVKAKKPGNSTVMSFRMIRSQAEKVADRIAEYKRKAESGVDTNSDDDSISEIKKIDQQSTTGMENSAAALFGFGRGTSSPVKQNSSNFDNSAAALFGFSSKPPEITSPNNATMSMDNSAAALFGVKGMSAVSETSAIPETTTSEEAQASLGEFRNFKAVGESSEEISAVKEKVSVPDNSDSDDDSSDSSTGPRYTKNQPAKMKSAPAALAPKLSHSKTGVERKGDATLDIVKEKDNSNTASSFFVSDNSKSDDGNRSGESSTPAVDPAKPSAAPQGPKKKSFLDDSDSDSDSDEETRPALKVGTTATKSLDLNPGGKSPSGDSDITEIEKRSEPNNVVPVPVPKKKSFLDDSDSDSDSDNSDKKKSNVPVEPLKQAPVTPPTDGQIPRKKSFLDDSDSDDDSEDDKPLKSSVVEPKAASQERQTLQLPSAQKKPFLDDSQSANNSSSGTAEPPPAKNESPDPVPPPKKKSFLDDSDSDDSDDDEPKVLTPAKPTPSENQKSATGPKKSFLDDSSDEEEEEVKAQVQATTPAMATSQASTPTPGVKKSSFLDDSDSDSDSDDEKPKKSIELSKPVTNQGNNAKLATTPLKPTLSHATPTEKKKSFLDDSDSEDDSDDDNKKVKPPKAVGSAPATATPKKKSFLDDSSSDESSDDEKPKKQPPKAVEPTISKPKSFLDDSDSDNSKSEENKAKTTPAKARLAAAAKKKKSFLDDSDSEDDSSKEKPRSTPTKPTTPAYAQESVSKKTPSTVDKDSSSDESSVESKKKLPTTNRSTPKDTNFEAEFGNFAPTGGESGKRQEAEATTGDSWAVDFGVADIPPQLDDMNDEARQEAEWQEALQKLAAEEQHKSEEQEQAAWQAALQGLSTNTGVELKSSDDPWDAALKEIEAEDKVKTNISSGKDDATKKKGGDSIKKSRDKENDKKKGSDKKTEKKKDKEPKTKKEAEKSDPIAKLTAKPKKMMAVIKTPKRSSKAGDTTPFDATPFAASPFGRVPVAAFGTPDEKVKKKGLAVKETSTPKRPKSAMKLVVQTAKPKGDLHKKRSKKGKKETGDDDDSFGDMNDFDDNFSIADDFGDFAEDGSVVPLKAVRNAPDPKKQTPKPPIYGNKKVKPNMLVKSKKDSDKDKSKDKSKDKTKEKSKVKAKDDKGKDSSKGKAADSKGDSRNRDKTDEKKSRSRSKSVSKTHSSRSKSGERRTSSKKKA